MGQRLGLWASALLFVAAAACSSSHGPATTSPPLSTTSRLASPAVAVVRVASLFGHVQADGEHVTLTLVSTSDQSQRMISADTKYMYRFDDVMPGNYVLHVAYESPAAKCTPGQPCIGSAAHEARHDITLQPGEAQRRDF